MWERGTESDSQPASWLSAAWYAVLWVLLLGAVIYGLARGNSLVSPALAATFVTFAIFSVLAVRAATRLVACLAVTTLAVPLYLFEGYLWLTGVPDVYGSQPKVEDVIELRERGVTAYPAVFPRGFLHLWEESGRNGGSPITIGGQEILPLAGIPDVLTVYCHSPDLGVVTYQSDPLGFRNSARWDREGSPEFALLGDSFVQGFCVSEEATYAAQLSELGPTASFGMNGTSVLGQFAIYREYVERLQPAHVVWFFYEGNDVTEYLAERSWPLLRPYLDPSHVQALLDLKQSKSAAMKRFIDERLASKEVATVTRSRLPPDSLIETLPSVLLLRRSRAILPQIAVAEAEPLPTLTETQWAEIGRLWRHVIEAQRDHGGRITFVYLPSHSRFVVEDASPFLALERRVMEAWSEMAVDHVSTSRLLHAVDTPLAYYEKFHFDEDGYQLTGQSILQHLRDSRQQQVGCRTEPFHPLSVVSQ